MIVVCGVGISLLMFSPCIEQLPQNWSGFFIDSCIKMFKLLAAAALVAVVAADGPPAYGAPPAYHPAPAYKPVEKLPPQPYAYEYGVADDYSKANFKKTETQDAEGKVAGSFTIAL